MNSQKKRHFSPAEIVVLRSEDGKRRSNVKPVASLAGSNAAIAGDIKGSVAGRAILKATNQPQAPRSCPDWEPVIHTNSSEATEILRDLGAGFFCRWRAIMIDIWAAS